MKRNEIIVLALVAAVMGAMGLWAVGTQKHVVVPPPCSLNAGPCEVNGYYLDISRPIKAMANLAFSVVLTDASLKTDASPLALTLDMPGMDMGLNRVKLKKVYDIRYSGKVVLPRCPSGKKLWRAVVTDLSMRELAVVEFEVE